MSTVSQSIPVERLWELYDYNPLTGQLWSKHRKRYTNGTYRHRALNIRVQGHVTNYGRVVFAWCTGAWPTNQVDHINRNTHDNQIWNLRDLTNRQNSQNTKRFQGGATYDRRQNSWFARIQVDKKMRFLGTFSSKAEAQAAYQLALKELS
jgi:hypothetical protein